MVLTPAEAKDKLSDIINVLVRDCQTYEIDFRRVKRTPAKKFLLALYQLLSFRQFGFKTTDLQFLLKAEAAVQILKFFNKWDFNILEPLSMYALFDEIIVSRLDADEKSLALFIALLQVFITWSMFPNTLDIDSFITLFSNNLKLLGDALNGVISPGDFAAFAVAVKYPRSEEFNYIFLNETNRIGTTSAAFTEYPTDGDENKEILFAKLDGMRAYDSAIKHRDATLMEFKYEDEKKTLKNHFNRAKQAIQEVIFTLQEFDQPDMAQMEKDFLSFIVVPAQQGQEQKFFKFHSVDYTADLDDENVEAAEALKNVKAFGSVEEPPLNIAIASIKQRKDLDERLGLVTQADIDARAHSPNSVTAPSRHRSPTPNDEEVNQFKNGPPLMVANESMEEDDEDEDITSSRSRLRIAMRKNGRLENQLSDLQKEVFDNTSRYERENDQYQRDQVEIGRLKAKIEELEKQKQAEEQPLLQEKNLQIANLKAALKDKDAELKKARESAQIGYFGDANASREDDLQALNTALERANEDIGCMNAKIEELEHEITQRDRARHEKDKTITKLYDELGQASRELTNANDEIQRLKQDNLRLGTNFAEKAQEVYIAQCQVHAGNGQIKRLEQQLAEEKEHFSTHRAHCELREDDYKEINELAVAKEQVLTLQAQLNAIAIQPTPAGSVPPPAVSSQNVRVPVPAAPTQQAPARTSQSSVPAAAPTQQAPVSSRTRQSSVPAAAPTQQAPVSSRTRQSSVPAAAPTQQAPVSSRTRQLSVPAEYTPQPSVRRINRQPRTNLEGVFGADIEELTRDEIKERADAVKVFEVKTTDPGCCRRRDQFYVCSNMNKCRGKMWYHRFCAGKAFHSDLIDHEADEKHKYDRVEALMAEDIWFCKICADDACYQEFKRNYDNLPKPPKRDTAASASQATSSSSQQR
uniref:Uncharacterized protein n=1 Tax=Panagrolaimus davidi TaxID=227884 RepID=A0A914PM21_9BILA